jgi:hypothetical protein
VIEKSESVIAEVFLDVMDRANGIIDQIKSNLSSLKGEAIKIVLDNSPTHQPLWVKEEINNIGKEDGWNIELDYQSAPSPDLNVLDLLFFWSLQKRDDVLKYQCKTIADLKNHVLEAFDEYDSNTIERCIGCLYANYVEVLKHDGGSDFHTPHSGVRKRAAGEDFTNIPITKEFIRDIRQKYNIA